jgi:hypothetical protein
MELSASHPGLLNPKKRVPGSHFLRGWVGLRALKIIIFVILKQ